jgi:hypothetical protein
LIGQVSQIYTSESIVLAGDISYMIGEGDQRRALYQMFAVVLKGRPMQITEE